MECEVSGVLKADATLKVISTPEHVTLGSFSLVWSPARCTMACVPGSYLSRSLLYLLNLLWGIEGGD